MVVTSTAMACWCHKLLVGDEESRRLTLDDYLSSIPRLETLANLPRGTCVLVRGDLDAKPGPTLGAGDVRLRSMKDTLRFGQERGWKQVIFGHIGREPEKSLSKVATRLGEILGCSVPLVSDWLAPTSLSIRQEAVEALQRCPEGGVVMLENVRKYEIERVLWKAKPADIDGLAESLARLANEFAEKLGRVYVHEAFSAGSLDVSSVVLPAAMEKVALGLYEAEQFHSYLKDCLRAGMVIFSGLKIDKLDDLQAIIDRGAVRVVLAAGSLAMALKKAAAQLEGKDFHLGVAEDPAHKDKPYYIPPERVAQAKQMLAAGQKKGIKFVLPVDFVLQDGRVSSTIGPGQQQFDVGSASSALYEQTVSEFIATERGKSPPAVVFHNGVFGMFEDSRFEEGTRRFIAQLKRMTDAGLRVYVGGGEGGTALEKYGQENWVTYCFTAGGTVLNALGSQPVPYLVALRMAAQGECKA